MAVGWKSGLNAKGRISSFYPKSMMKNWAELKLPIVFDCNDFEDTYKKLNTNNVELIAELEKMWWGTYAQFKDPDGNTFLLRE